VSSTLLQTGTGEGPEAQPGTAEKPAENPAAGKEGANNTGLNILKLFLEMTRDL
jgi:hypothetical protein